MSRKKPPTLSAPVCQVNTVCRKCGFGRAEVLAQTFSNGEKHARPRCLKCKSLGKFVPRARLLGYQGNATPAAEQRPATERQCPDCRSPMRLIGGKSGMYWGCTSYPDCTCTLRTASKPAEPVYTPPVDPEPLSDLDREYRALIRGYGDFEPESESAPAGSRLEPVGTYAVVREGCGAALAECPF